MDHLQPDAADNRTREKEVLSPQNSQFKVDTGVQIIERRIVSSRMPLLTQQREREREFVGFLLPAKIKK